LQHDCTTVKFGLKNKKNISQIQAAEIK